jgi:hypothetical protein
VSHPPDQPPRGNGQLRGDHGGSSPRGQHRPGPAAYPDAPPEAPSFEEEIETAIRYEQRLVLKALLAIALVAVALLIRFYG